VLRTLLPSLGGEIGGEITAGLEKAGATLLRDNDSSGEELVVDVAPEAAWKNC